MRHKYLSLFFFIMPFVAQAGTMGSTASQWQGRYIGGNIGAAWGLLTNELSIGNNTANPLFYPPSIPGINYSGSNWFNPLRFSGGVQGGFNYELNSQILTGLEISYNYINLSETVNRAYPYPDSPTLHFYSIKNSASATQLGTLRPRLGYHYGAYLPYVTAGGAITNLNYKQTFTDHQYALSHTMQLNKTRLGWTVGAGLEYLPMNKLSFKLEYLYANFGNTAVNSTLYGTGALSGLSATFNNALNHIAIQTVLLGINYHFA